MFDGWRSWVQALLKQRTDGGKSLCMHSIEICVLLSLVLHLGFRCFERPFRGCLLVCVCVCGVNYKDKRTVEKQEGVVNTQQGGKGGANNDLWMTRLHTYRPIFVFLAVIISWINDYDTAASLRRAVFIHCDATIQYKAHKLADISCWLIRK